MNKPLYLRYLCKYLDISTISTQYLHHLIRDIVRRGGKQLRQGELVHPGAGAAILHLNVWQKIIGFRDISGDFCIIPKIMQKIHHILLRSPRCPNMLQLKWSLLNTEMTEDKTNMGTLGEWCWCEDIIQPIWGHISCSGVVASILYSILSILYIDMTPYHYLG